MSKWTGRKVPKPRDVIRTRRREHWLQRHERELEEHQAEIAHATAAEMRAVETSSGGVSRFRRPRRGPAPPQPAGERSG